VTCLDDPCKNGGTCVNIKSNTKSPSNYKCNCQKYFSGKMCEKQLDKLCLIGDNSVYCSVWNLFGFCAFEYSFESLPIPLHCPRTCGLCRPCEDNFVNCKLWSMMGQCDLVRSVNSDYCRKSCNVC
jgi:hypothetical protein